MSTPPFRLSVDREKCIGSGMCTSIAPQAFELDDDGVLVVLVDPALIPTADLSAVEDAVACCPVEALSLVPLSSEPTT